MIVYTFSYKSTDHVRKPSACGMDSDFSHTEVTEKTCAILSPRLELARAYIDTRGGNNRDPAFEVLGVTESKLDAIIGVDHGLGFNTRR